ncbi:ROK family transcriptional regulator [Brachybacterium sp. AOP43-C2-M15]|uniref:ROK family transcriptional regulator n=1 Tax=Brachybacterium sp. AOP43-C2-M15 TaxID=3457661 RepID=UPI004033C2AB
MTMTGERRSSSTDAAILEMVRRRTVTTRVEISRELGVTPATVTYAVKRLLAAGLVVEAGHARSNGGKRASLLRLNDRARWAIGCTIGSDRVSVVAVDMTGALRSRAVVPLGAGAEAGDVAHVLDRALSMMEQDRELPTTTGIGFALPQGGAGSTARLYSALSESLPHPTVSAASPLCAALGSFWSGEQPEAGLTATVHVEEGIGLALLRDGAPLLRAGTVARSTMDHLCVDPAGPPCRCGGRGCLHQYSSSRAIARAAELREGLAERLGLALTEASTESDAVLVAVAAAQGDELAQEALEPALTALAQASWGLASALAVDTVVFSGAALQAAAGLVREALAEHFASRSAATGHAIDVRVSQVQPHPGSVGAAVLALQTFMDPSPAIRS